MIQRATDAPIGPAGVIAALIDPDAGQVELDAGSGLAELEEDKPRAPSRVPAFDWSKERKRQMDLYSGGRKPRNVHPGPSGWSVALVRGKTHYYIGHFQDLRLALEARDKAETKYPSRGRNK